MDILHFKCPSCAKLMGVIREALGTQMRCPHCNQIQLVTLASAPTRELPQPGAPIQDSSPFEPAHDTVDFVSGTNPQDNSPESLMRTEESPAPAEPPPAPQEASPATLSQPESPAPMPWENAGSLTGAEAKKRAPSGSNAMSIFFFSLVSYSVLATALLIMLILRLQTKPLHPLEYLPDVDGDNPGVKRTRIRFNNDKERTLLPLPDQFKLKLGQSARVGELEVTPLRVERKKVGVLVSGFSKSEPCNFDSLVLHLKLKNLSSGQTIAPLDPFFNRRWKERQTNPYPPPFTLVSLQGGEHYFGGPATWLPLQLAGAKISQRSRETVEGDNLDKELAPGEETQAWVCTDGQDEKTQTLFTHGGPINWRVQVRRGLVDVGNRQLPATAVISVDFRKEDIENIQNRVKQEG
ncbi:MAG: hypothetical protein EXR99_13330 [Gemmataceae bacterium]|nr:hypothetical protein [Gemmataceae bacterium]